MYYIRRNVALGIKLLKINENGMNLLKIIQNYIKSSYCQTILENSQSKILDGLKQAINSLNWHHNDLPAENCQNLDSKTVWIPDFHDGPRVDITSLLVHLGQKPILAGTKGYDSPFPEAIKLGKLVTRLSSYVKKYSDLGNIPLNMTFVEENYNFYKNDNDFKTDDYVFCAFASSMCEGFIPLNKTIIINPAHQYSICRCDKDRWELLNANYYRLKNRSKLIASAMGRYDEEYMARFTGLREYQLYAYGGFYAKNVNYEPNRDEILVGKQTLLSIYITDRYLFKNLVFFYLKDHRMVWEEIVKLFSQN
jgi:hypothetical protein